MESTTATKAKGAYYTSAIKPRYTAHLVHDDSSHPYKWQEGVTLHTWNTQTITDLRGVGADYWRPGPKVYLAEHGREESSETHVAFLIESWDDRNGQMYRLATSFGRVHGVLYVPRDFTNPREAAKAILSEYQAWAQGDVYGVVIRDVHGETVESCWGYIGKPWGDDSWPLQALRDDASHWDAKVVEEVEYR